MGLKKTITDLRTGTEITNAYVNVFGFANGEPVFQIKKDRDTDDNLVLSRFNILDDATDKQKKAYDDDLKALAYKHVKLIKQNINGEEKIFTDSDNVLEIIK